MPVLAGAAYFAAIFFAGFALGTLRVLAVEPVVGALAAVALELPVILAVAWIACAFITRRLAVVATLSDRLTMGGVAFACLMTAELLLSALAFGRSPAEVAADLSSPEGLLGLAGQIGFAAIPALRLAARRVG